MQPTQAEPKKMPTSPLWQQLLAEVKQARALYDNQEPIKAALYAELLMKKVESVNLLECFSEDFIDLLMVYCSASLHKNQLVREKRLDGVAWHLAADLWRKSPDVFAKTIQEELFVCEAGKGQDPDQLATPAKPEEKPVNQAVTQDQESKLQMSAASSDAMVSFSGSFS